MEWLKKLIEKHTKDGVLNQEELNKEINTEFPKYAVPKETYNTLSDTKKKLEQDITDRDKQLEDLKKVDAAGLQAEITRLQGENKTAKEKYESDMKEISQTNALKLKLIDKVHDVDIVVQLMDRSKLVFNEDGSITGFDEHFKTAISDSRPFLLKETEPPGTGGSLGNGSRGGGEPPVADLGTALKQHYTK